MTAAPVVDRHKTAMSRQELSRPMRLALADGIIDPDDTILDYGCGLGGDVRRLRGLGYSATGWDPVHAAATRMSASNVVNLGYVVNVIEDPVERAAALRAAWSLTEDVLVVSGRLTDERSQLRTAQDHADGVLTSLNTFQKFFLQSELREWIRQELDLSPIAAAPGVFYVFRKSERQTRFAAARFRTRISYNQRPSRSDRLAAHPEFTRIVMEGLNVHGREISAEDLPDGAAIADVLGGMRSAVRILVEQMGPERWDSIRRTRRNDLLVYLALGRFEGRTAFRSMPPTLQRDLRAHFGGYGQAMQRADEALLETGRQDTIEGAIAEAQCGKLLPAAFYVHASALSAMPVPLRLYEGCARALAGTVDGANLVKLSRRERKVSYLAYPDFERNAHPELRHSTRVDLQTFDVRTRRYDEGGNPPVLHRKETFVLPDDPNRLRYARLTAAEDKAGLLADGATIGTRGGWLEALEAAGLTLRGHTLRPASGAGVSGRAVTGREHL